MKLARRWEDGDVLALARANPGRSAGNEQGAAAADDEGCVFGPASAQDHAWMQLKRHKLCAQVSSAVDSLIEKELHANSEQLTSLVSWLCSSSRSEHTRLLGDRLVGAVMQSNMGATVDRAVYHPLLRACLAQAQHWPLSVVVPLVASECASPHDALEQIGKQLWAAASQRGAAPKNVFCTDVMCAVAQQWARDKPDVVPGVLVLVEDFATFDRRFLSSLFQTLAEATRRQQGRRALCFAVVLWASCDTPLDAHLFEHLYLSRFAFIPPSTMLNNVVFAALIEPALPFDLPSDVLTWIVRHMETHSHSLLWLAHILKCIARLHFMHETSWLLDTTPSTYPSLQQQLQDAHGALKRWALLPEGLAFGGGKERDRPTVLQWLAERRAQHERYRSVRCVGFVALWRLLRAVVGDKAKSVIEAYCDCLQLGGQDGTSRQLYVLQLQRTVDEHLQLQQDEAAAMASLQAVQRELDAVQADTRAAPLLPESVVDALLTLLQAARQELVLRDAVAAAAAGAAAPVPAAASKSVLLLQSGSKAAQHSRAGHRAARSSKQVVLESVAESAGKAQRCAAAIGACLRVLVEGALVPAVADSGPYVSVCASTVTLERLQQGLLGDLPRALLRELHDQASLPCQCCPSIQAVQSGSRKRAKVLDAESGGKWSHVYPGPLDDLAHREDLCVAYLYWSRIDNDKRALDVADWRNFFAAVFEGTDDVDGRFVAATTALRTMGLIVQGVVVKGAKSWRKNDVGV